MLAQTYIQKLGCNTFNIFILQDLQIFLIYFFLYTKTKYILFSIYNILFLIKMQIATHDLFQVTIQQNKLMNNFIIIQQMIKNLTERVTTIEKDVNNNIININQNKSMTQKNKQVITKHENKLHQISSKIKIICQDIDIIKQCQVNMDDESQMSNKNIEKNCNQDQKCMQDQEIKHAIVGQNNNQTIKNRQESIIKNQQKDNKKVAQKSKLQKIITNLKDRIIYLQNKQNQNQKIIQKIKESIQQSRQVSQISQINMQRLPSQHYKNNQKGQIQRKNVKNKTKTAHNNPLDKDNNQNKQIYYKNINEANLQQNAFNSQFKNNQCQTQSLNQFLIQRLKQIQLHLKQTQNKTSSIQKTLDLLQRSHEILKYDMQRTASTAFTKTRNNTTQDKYRSHDSKLNDTRLTDHSYYQDKIVEIFNQMDNLRNQYVQLANKIQKQQKDYVKCPTMHSESSKNKIGSKIISNLNTNQAFLKRQLALTKRDLKKLTQQFQQFAYGINIGTNQTKTILIKPNQTKQDWKSLSTKMFKLKMQLNTNIKQLQSKILSNNDTLIVINQLQAGIQQCRILMRKKVEINDYQKNIKRLENRLNNFIVQIYQKQGIDNQLDPSIVKQPWFCLSCDNQFKNYSGKNSKHIHAQKLNGKKVNTENHMVRRNQHSKLPSVLK